MEIRGTDLSISMVLLSQPNVGKVVSMKRFVEVIENVNLGVCFVSKKVSDGKPISINLEKYIWEKILF